jgi:hypothetical protein
MLSFYVLSAGVLGGERTTDVVGKALSDAFWE